MPNYLLLALLLSLNPPLAATPQAPDRLIVNGDTSALLVGVYRGDIDREGLDRASNDLNMMTSCWDRVIAYWEICNDSLWLNGFQACLADSNGERRFLPAHNFYPTAVQPVFANWVDRELIVGEGEYLGRPPGGSNPTYEFEMGYKVRLGMVCGQHRYDNRRTNITDFGTGSLTLRKFAFDNIPWGTFRDTSFMIVVGGYTDDQGRVDSTWIMRAAGMPYDSIAQEVIRELPPLSVYYRLGEPVRQRWMFPLCFQREWYEGRVGER